MSDKYELTSPVICLPSLRALNCLPPPRHFSLSHPHLRAPFTVWPTERSSLLTDTHTAPRMLGNFFPSSYIETIRRVTFRALDNIHKLANTYTLAHTHRHTHTHTHIHKACLIFSILLAAASLRNTKSKTLILLAHTAQCTRAHTHTHTHTTQTHTTHTYAQKHRMYTPEVSS